MASRLKLDVKEATLRRLLLEVSQYIHDTQNVPTPELRFAGGWVRDRLLGTSSKDIDVAIDNMTGEKFGLAMKAFLDDRKRSAHYDENLVRRIAKIVANPDKSKNLETATTKVLGLDIDLVGLRKDAYTSVSRNPSIEPGTPQEDAERRDSTVNALFYNLQTEEIEDFTGRGLDDLQRKIIRTPLEPYQTFKDDPLRILRCIRFASRLGYAIDPKALEGMKDKGIQETLKLKISRERVGIEIEKMLKGPDPRKALQLIDEQELYDTIFSNPEQPGVTPENRARWCYAYNRLAHYESDASPSRDLHDLLITSDAERYAAWMMTALLPWGQQSWPAALKLAGRPRRVYPAAAVVGREGLKLDNKMLDMIINAIEHSAEVVKLATFDSIEAQGRGEARVTEPDPDLREQHGMAIRKWGPHWRSTALYALLAQVQASEDPSPYEETIVKWLKTVKDLDLGEAYAIKPMIDGGELMKALGRKPGQWLAGALELVVRWQLRNPGVNDKGRLIEHVRKQLDE